jgi:hypothetical protein
MSLRDGTGGDSAWEECRDRGVAVIAYDTMEFDLSKYEKGEPKNSWSTLSSAQYSSLARFAYGIKEGDVIYVKEGPQIVGRGTVQEEYYFDPYCSIKDSRGRSWPHLLGVTWDFGFQPIKVQIGSNQLFVVEPLRDEDLRKVNRASEELKLRAFASSASPKVRPPSEVFVSPPTKIPSKKTTRGGRRIPFDAAGQSDENAKLGRKGEEWVLKFEKKRLRMAQRADLAARVVWASETIGDGLGYDIRSFTEDGKTILIEVKTTNGVMGRRFPITDHELNVADVERRRYRVYRVFNFAKKPQIYQLKGPLRGQLLLVPLSYSAIPQLTKRTKVVVRVL